ncbi:hypothetical protein H5410_021565 [Solanum commersonii]|uniref:Uncharacterized protein n=1 Tax=Solanum commersonii TaxID=4109 RepID=A0A9J5ZFH2_SOLCO|nr:hypothetical protein H5410_021565 [Solanum commersonii]
MSTHSLGHQSSGLSFATSLSGKPKTHGWFSKEEEWRRSISNLGKMKSFSLQFGEVSRVHQKTRRLALLLSHRRLLLDFSILTFWTIGRVDCSFHRLFDPLPSWLRKMEQKKKYVLLANRQRCLAMLRLQLLRSFQPFCFFLRLSVHASTKTSNN